MLLLIHAWHQRRFSLTAVEVREWMYIYIPHKQWIGYTSQSQLSHFNKMGAFVISCCCIIDWMYDLDPSGPFRCMSLIMHQGLHSPSGRMSYRKIWRCLEAPRFGFNFSNGSEVWQAPRQQRCRDARQISERYDHCNIQSRGFETSRNLTVRSIRLVNKGPGTSFTDLFFSRVYFHNIVYIITHPCPCPSFKPV